LAGLTDIWLVNAAPLDVALFLTPAFKAEEVGFFHFGDNVTTPDDDTFQLNEFIDAYRVDLSNTVGLPQIKGAYLQDLVFLLVA